jgi:hypothetical protein
MHHKKLGNLQDRSKMLKNIRLSAQNWMDCNRDYYNIYFIISYILYTYIFYLKIYKIRSFNAI